MHNTTLNNASAPILIQKIAQWHHDRNLIEGTTSVKQLPKLMEEFSEVVAACYPDKSADFIVTEMIAMISNLHSKGRIKPVAEKDAHVALLDGLGDMMVVQINILERNTWSVGAALGEAYHAIKDRKGKMIDGIFVKEEDL